MSQNPPGRFLDFDSQLSDWKIISYKRAVEKASQSLREGKTNPRRKPSSIREEERKVSKCNEDNIGNISEKSETNQEIVSKPNSQYNPSQIDKAFCFRSNSINHSQRYTSNVTNVFTNLTIDTSSSSYDQLILATLKQDYHNDQLPQYPTYTFQGKPYPNTQDMRNSHIAFIDGNRLLHSKEDIFGQGTIESDEEIDDYILMALMDDSNQMCGYSDFNMKADIQKSNKLSTISPNLVKQAKKKTVASAA